MQETSTSPIPLRPPPVPARDGADPTAAPPKRKLKKLRLALVLLVLSALALLSTVFGMMMAVSNELPQLENAAQFKAARNSTVYAAGGKQEIGHLTDARNRILLNAGDISPNVKNAVVAIEDQRFYEHEGVDFTGIGRAVFQDLLRQKAAQGASTITQQFVKNALAAQRDRTVFQKLREAALAYHLERRWSKDKILTEYLNTVYFGNGAYGIESAVRTYFGGRGRHYLPSDRLAKNVTPAQAAMLAALIASPSAYDPAQHPIEAEQRRDLVLKNMLNQGLLTRADYDTAIRQVIPTQQQISPPQPDSTQPYFSTWVAQQLVDRYGAGAAFGGGLKVTTTLDPAFQRAAEQAIRGRLGAIGPSSSVVVIDNHSGAVRAMVGGTDYEERPFNLATNGHRQPGSSIKPFILATALEHGYGPGSVWTSGPKAFPFTNHGVRDVFRVHNFENEYAGSATLASATAHSDNSVFAEIGMKLGPKRVAREAHQMGIKTKLGTNPAMLLGGLKQGVTPLEMSFAFSTIANRGRRVSGSLASSHLGPVAIEKVVDPSGSTIDKNKVKDARVYSTGVGEQMRAMLHLVVTSGTGRNSAVSEWSAGKTGTTENYGDAWFCGFTDRYTACVWVGYADKVKSMLTEYRGGSVQGGTYPAEIWHDLMTSLIAIENARHPDRPSPESGTPLPVLPSGPAPAPTAPAETPEEAPQEPQQQQQQTPPQQPAPTPPTGGGQGGGGGQGTGGGTKPGGTGQ
jgi:penicillin-binding protein 1A